MKEEKTTFATRLSDEDYTRLKKITKDYGFKSESELLRTLLEGLIKVTGTPEERADMNKDLEEFFLSVLDEWKKEKKKEEQMKKKKRKK